MSAKTTVPNLDKIIATLLGGKENRPGKLIDLPEQDIK